MSRIKILIVEDEIILAQDLSSRLSHLNYDITGIAESADQALGILNQVTDIDIILLDIKIKGDKDGIELAQSINEQFNIPFIFLTSHADIKVVERAKRVKPYAYLLKPFNDRQISVAIELALSNFSRQAPEKELLKAHQFSEEENSVLKIKDSLFLKKNGRFQRVLLNEIQFLQADNNYTTIYTSDNSFLYSTVLKKMEQHLPASLFLRVHRSYIINVASVQGFEGNMLYIDDHKIPVSKSNRDAVFKLFRVI